MLKLLFLFGIASLIEACETPPNPRHQTGVQPAERPAHRPRTSGRNDSTNKTNPYYPFVLSSDGGYTIAVEIETKDIMARYTPLFEKYGFSGSGESWAGLIRHILATKDPALLGHLDFDPEAGGFFAAADNEKTQKEFGEVVGRIFQDIPTLESYMKTADKSEMND